MLSTPFVGALLLWTAAKLLRFTRTSYLAALQSVLIAACAYAAVGAIVWRPALARAQDMGSAVVLIALIAIGPALAVCAIAVVKLFGESVGKSAGAVGLSFATGFVYFVIMIWAVPSLAFTGGVEGSPIDFLRGLLSGSTSQPIDYPVTVIRIVPLGAIPASDVEAVRQIVGQEFPRITVTVGDPLELPSASFDSARRQYNAEALLGLLAQRAPDRGVRVVGVADVDLFSPGLNFVFSSAQPKGSGVVMSLYDLRDPRESLSRERYRKIVLRALGITFGFETSLDRSYVMAFSNSLPDLDGKGTAWCGKEPEALKRIQGLR
ncbi:MAG TPA: hypothetical protein VEW91_00250 [bacterium]|nr:hypothetical protein [bacterium]